MEEETTNSIDDEEDGDDEDDVKTPIGTTESVIDENVSIYANETSNISTSTMPNLEGIDYKLSKYFLSLFVFQFLIINSELQFVVKECSLNQG